ncbi:MAG: hypothetical protein ACYTG0_23760 [Planctomycetota bacterium]|jgi:hypothetical protein
MKRRELLQNSIAAALGGRLLSNSAFGQDAAMPELDRFGGWKGKTFEATGFFRTEHDGKRWWLVTPEGNAFLSFGINHIHAGWWKQPYDRDAWKRILGVSQLQGPEFDRAFRAWFMKDRHLFGFNTLGVHNELRLLNKPAFMPYMQPIHFVDVPHWKQEIPDGNFVDVFSDEFAARCDRLARTFAGPVADDPFVLGYSMTDCPLFTEEDCRERVDVIGGKRRGARVGWPRRLRNLGPDAPGKRAYVETMRELYRDRITDFNATYATKHQSFDALAQARDWRRNTDLSNGNETRDNVEFLKRVVDKYYQVAKGSIRRHDPNHLFVGDKLNANTDTVDTVLPVTSKYTDIVFYQMYAKYGVQELGLDRWTKIVDQPFINGDSSFASITEMTPRPFGPIAYDQQQKAQWAREFMERAFARPDFVGWHYCGLIDTWKSGGTGSYFDHVDEFGKSAGRQHTGLLKADGTPYQPIRKMLKESTDRLYQIAVSRL